MCIHAHTVVPSRNVLQYPGESPQKNSKKVQPQIITTATVRQQRLIRLGTSNNAHNCPVCTLSWAAWLVFWPRLTQSQVCIPAYPGKPSPRLVSILHSSPELHPNWRPERITDSTFSLITHVKLWVVGDS